VAHDAVRDRWLLVLLHHHLANDHTTLQILIEEIRAHVLGRTDRLAPPVPFRNFVAQARLGVSAQEHEAFFRDLLGDVDEPTVPFGLVDVRGDGRDVEEARVGLDAELARRLRERARALGVSPASLFHLAWAQVLARTSGRQDVVFGTVMFGRMQGGEHADRTLGMFINTLPVRIRVGDEGVEDSVRHTHKLLTELLHHEHASLASAQRCSALAPSVPLFSALLNYRHIAKEQREALAGWKGIKRLADDLRTNYPLTLAVDDLGDGFLLTAQVQEAVGAERVCGFMCTALSNLADALERAPTTPVWHLEVLPALERRRLLEEWKDTAAEYVSDKYIRELEVPLEEGGEPIMRRYVLDHWLGPAPVGVVGELYIGGAGLRGSVRQPGLTAAHFLPDPFGSGGRLYRTGDLARWRADGNLEFLGRVDHQVKIRGYRIELGEIEAVLRNAPEVKDCAVAARKDAPAEKRLVACVVPSGEGMEAATLRAHLRRRLPEYMVPSAFVVLEALPLTPNGKVDRKALPAPEDDAVVCGEYVAPRTPTEEVLAGIWRELLKLERVGVHDNFFELGGHSLLAMRVIARIREELAVELPLRVLFETPSVAELCERVLHPIYREHSSEIEQCLGCA
jgi:acyl carrier protein